MADQILYQDDGIMLSNTYILIKKYYFPLATSKTIMFTDVQTVQLNNTQGVNHRWGICTKYLNNWFNLDSKRGDKKKFIAIKLKNKNIKPSITPDDADKNQTPQGREYVQKTTQNVGKQTQINQKQIMQRMEEQKANQEMTMNDLKAQK